VTSFDDLDRGDVIWGTDPLSDTGRPMLVVGSPRFPSHGVQIITALVSTKTYHDDAITLRDRDYGGEPLGERSHVLPWSLATLNNPATVDKYLTSLVEDRTDDVATRTIGYLSA